MKKLTYIIALVVLLAATTSCSVRDWPTARSEHESEGQGRLEVLLKGAATRATTTTITQEEANLFLVTIAKGDDIIAQQTQLGKIGSMTFPAGYGYKLFVESITEREAETLNEGWGAKRFAGNSKSFGIQSGQTTKVSVNCTVANAAVKVSMADEIEGCTVTITDGTRTLITTEGGKTAYFNIPPDVTLDVTLKVEKGGQLVSQQSLSLEPAQVKDVNLQPSEPEQETGTFGIHITYDDYFDIIPEEIIVKD